MYYVIKTISWRAPLRSEFCREPDEAFDGKITVRTTNVPHHMLLYDSDVDEAITVGDDRALQLLRHVVAVSKGELLMIGICCRSDDQSDGIDHCVCEFAPRMEGAVEQTAAWGPYERQSCLVHVVNKVAILLHMVIH